MNIGLLAALVGIAVVDSLNPSLFMGQFFLLTQPRPVPRSLQYIAGILTVNGMGGLLILAGIRAVITAIVQALDPHLGFAAQVGIGLACLWFGLRIRWDKPSPDSPTAAQSGWGSGFAFLFGAVVMLNELTTALPYFVALERIAEAQLSLPGTLAAVVLYNIVFSLPLFGFLLLYLRLKDRFAAVIARINAGVQRWTPRIFKIMLLVCGAALLANGGAFFLSGHAIF